MGPPSMGNPWYHAQHRGSAEATPSSGVGQEERKKQLGEVGLARVSPLQPRPIWAWYPRVGRAPLSPSRAQEAPDHGSKISLCPEDVLGHHSQGVLLIASGARSCTQGARPPQRILWLKTSVLPSLKNPVLLCKIYEGRDFCF